MKKPMLPDFAETAIYGVHYKPYCLRMAFMYFQKSYQGLRAWFVITVTMCMTGFYFFIPGVIFTEDSYHFVSVFILSYAFTVYSLWVVYSYLKELRTEGLHQPIYYSPTTTQDSVIFSKF